MPLFISTSNYYDAEAMQILQCVLNTAEAYSIGCGEGPMVCTSFYRPREEYPDSLHPDWCAVDIRCNDKPAWWIAGVIGIINAIKLKHRDLGYYTHPELAGTPRHHIHVQVKRKVDDEAT